MYKIADFVRVIDAESYFLVEYKKIWKILKSDEVNQIFDLACSRGINENSEFVNSKIFKFLRDNGLMRKEPPLSTTMNTRSYYYLDGMAQDLDTAIGILEQQRVCIVGLGGVGSTVLQLLCGSHISSYLLIDFDQVEISNLNRQFVYDKSDIGRYKTDVCRDYVKKHTEYFGEIQIANAQIKSSSQLVAIAGKFRPTIIVGAADKPKNISRIMLATADALNCKLVLGGVGPDMANYTFYEKARFVGDIETPIDTTEGKIIHEREVSYGSFGPTNTILSAMMANDIIMNSIGARTFGSSDGKNNILNFNDFNFRTR